MSEIGLATPRRVLVIGASGFIGQVLCRQLRQQCMYIRAGIRQETDGPWDDVIYLDLASQKFPKDAMAEIDTVFHLAGKAHALTETQQDEKEYFRINTVGTSRLLEIARDAGVRRFILFSSVKAMGEGGEYCQDESAECHPETPYGRSKLAAEKLVLEGGYIPEPVVLRLSMVYGSSRKGNLSRMIEAIAKGCFPPLPEVGNQRSMVHVEDVVQAALLAAKKPAAVGQSYIVTDGQVYSTRQLYEWICKALNKQVPAWTIPIRLLNLLAKAGDGIGYMRGRRFLFDSDALCKLIGSACYSSKKIERELKFLPKRNLQTALSEIISDLDLK